MKILFKNICLFAFFIILQIVVIALRVEAKEWEKKRDTNPEKFAKEYSELSKFMLKYNRETYFDRNHIIIDMISAYNNLLNKAKINNDEVAVMALIDLLNGISERERSSNNNKDYMPVENVLDKLSHAALAKAESKIMTQINESKRLFKIPYSSDESKEVLISFYKKIKKYMPKFLAALEKDLLICKKDPRADNLSEKLQYLSNYNCDTKMFEYGKATK